MHLGIDSKLAPETRSRVNTSTSTHGGHDEGAEWWNNPIGTWELKNKPVWLANWRHVMPRQANFSTHEGACSWNRRVQQICPWSLLPHIKPVWYEEAKLGSKRFVAQHIFSLEIVADERALSRERLAGPCWGSKLPRVYQPFLTKACVIKKECFVAQRWQIAMICGKKDFGQNFTLAHRHIHIWIKTFHIYG